MGGVNPRLERARLCRSTAPTEHFFITLAVSRYGCNSKSKGAIGTLVLQKTSYEFSDL
jgi:hypothetical protein